MTNRVGTSRPGGGDKQSAVSERVKAIAATSVTTILALQSTAFAQSDAIASPTQVIAAPVMGPAAIAVAGAAIATIGAYRLMRARKSEGRNRTP